MELCGNEDFTSATPISPNIAIVVMVGLPGSGKTTLCLSLPHILGSKFHVIHVCYDQIVPFNKHWSTEESHGLWKGERAKVLHSTEVLLCYLMDAKNSHREKKLNCKEGVSQNVTESTSDANGTFFCEDLSPKNEGGLELFPNNTHGKKCEFENSFNPLGEPSQKVNIESRCQNITDGCIGHYTMLDSFNQNAVSLEHEIKECDIQNEVFIVCVDDNCYYRSMRKEWWNLAAKYKLPFCIVTLDCKVSMCIERVRKRFNSTSQFCCLNVPPAVIERMAERLEFPDGKLFPWEKHSVVIESNSLDVLVDEVQNIISPSVIRVSMDEVSWESLNKIKELLCNAVLEPAKPFTKEIHSDCSAVTPSLVHRVDLALRRFVGKSEVSFRAQINKKRKIALEDLRSGQLSIPSDVLNEDCSEQEIDIYVSKLINLNQ